MSWPSRSFQHIGGTAPAVANFAPREFYDNPLNVRSTIQRQLLANVPMPRTHRHLLRGDALVFGPGVSAKILYPPPNLPITAADDAPLIVQVTLEEKFSVLFESDAGAEAETALLDASEELQSDILVKGQHYQGGSGTPQFLEAVRPQLIIATSRDTPVWERIPDQWVQTIAERGIQLFRQDQTGAVEIKFGSEEWQARSYLTGEIFRSRNR